MYEGISISELLKKLKITKQSLNRVLKDLIKLELIDFKKDDQDTRVKHLFLNEKGKKIFKEVISAKSLEPLLHKSSFLKAYLRQQSCLLQQQAFQTGL